MHSVLAFWHVLETFYLTINQKKSIHTCQTFWQLKRAYGFNPLTILTVKKSARELIPWEIYNWGQNSWLNTANCQFFSKIIWHLYPKRRIWGYRSIFKSYFQSWRCLCCRNDALLNCWIQTIVYKLNYAWREVFTLQLKSFVVLSNTLFEIVIAYFFTNSFLAHARKAGKLKDSDLKNIYNVHKFWYIHNQSRFDPSLILSAFCWMDDWPRWKSV